MGMGADSGALEGTQTVRWLQLFTEPVATMWAPLNHHTRKTAPTTSLLWWDEPVKHHQYEKINGRLYCLHCVKHTDWPGLWLKTPTLQWGSSGNHMATIHTHQEHLMKHKCVLMCGDPWPCYLPDASVNAMFQWPSVSGSSDFSSCLPYKGDNLRMEGHFNNSKTPHIWLICNEPMKYKKHKLLISIRQQTGNHVNVFK